MTQLMMTRAYDFDSLDIFDPNHGEIDVQVPGDPNPIKFPSWGKDLVIIGFDQSLANTGWAVMDFRHEVPWIVAKGTIKTKTADDRTSWDDTLERGTRILAAVIELLDTYPVDLVLHEMPPVGTGPFVRRSDASVVGATAVRGAASLSAIPVAHVAARKVKKHITGDPNAKKQAMKEAIEKRKADLLLVDTTEGRDNEHIYDAIGIILTFKETK